MEENKNLETMDALVRYIAERNDTHLVDTRSWLAAIIDSIIEALGEGRNVSIPRIGKFVIVEAPEHIGRNPLNGDAITIPAHNRLQFKINTSLKKKVKEIGE